MSIVDVGAAGTFRDCGAGSVIVFIVPGLGLAGAEWWPIQDGLSGKARVITWDRPGCGDSGPPKSARTTANIAAEALDVLAAVASDAPLIVVGHSQGGLYANAITRLAPSHVRGLVLLDPAHPDNARLRQDLPGEIFRRSGSDLTPRLRTARRLARLRLGVALRPLLMKSPPLSLCRDYPAEAIDSIWRHMKRAQTYETALSEYAELEAHTSHDDLAGLGPFPDIPVTLLLHDPDVMIDQMVNWGRLPREDAQRAEALWGELLRDTTYCGHSVKTETVTGAGHLIHLERPQIVVDAITQILDQAGDETA